MEIINVFKDGAIVDLVKEDAKILRMAFIQADQALKSDDTICHRYCGYHLHSFEYLHDWLFDNRPDPQPLSVSQTKADAYVKSTAPPLVPTDALLISKVTDVDGPALRVALTLDALNILDSALAATFDYHVNDNPPDGELGTITGYGLSDFIALQLHIKEILETEASL